MRVDEFQPTGERKCAITGIGVGNTGRSDSTTWQTTLAEGLQRRSVPGKIEISSGGSNHCSWGAFENARRDYSPLSDEKLCKDVQWEHCKTSLWTQDLKTQTSLMRYHISNDFWVIKEVSYHRLPISAVNDVLDVFHSVRDHQDKGPPEVHSHLRCHDNGSGASNVRVWTLLREVKWSTGYY